ncbi:MAG: ABC transporter permease [Anaerolineae bacterium]|nr:ABC transporter permease [Anaerolineae bacterium]
MESLHRMAQVARKEILELWRNAGVVAFILVIPVVEMTVLGFATAGGINDLPVAVCDADRSSASRRLIETIHQARSFEVVALVDAAAAGEAMLDAGEVSALFIVDSGFGRALVDGRGGASVAAVIDGSNTAVANYTAIYAEGVMAHFVAQSLGGSMEMPVTAEPRIWYNQDLRRENFYIPALLGIMLALVVLAITAVCIVRERERGTLERLMVSPVRPLELILGKLVPAIIIAYAELVVMLLIATQVFYVPIRGSLLLYVALMFVYLLAEMGVGILISTVATSQAQALPTIFLLVTMNGILAGFITPVETMPQIAQYISMTVPLRYFITITRELFAKGAGFQDLLPHLVPLVGMSVALFTLSTLLLRRRLV